MIYFVTSHPDLKIIEPALKTEEKTVHPETPEEPAPVIVESPKAETKPASLETARKFSPPKRTGENLRHKHQEVVLCLNYGPKSHVLFGPFGEKHAKFKDEYLKKECWIKPSERLALGFGWVLMYKNRIEEAKKAMEKFDVPYRVVEREKFENEIRLKKNGNRDISSFCN